MTKLKFAGLSLTIAAIVFGIMQYQARLKLVRDNESLREQLETLTAENERPATNVTTSDSFSKEQLSELLKLRGEVSGLRRETNELQKLRDQNRMLRERITTGANAASESQTKLPSDVPPE